MTQGEGRSPFGAVSKKQFVKLLSSKYSKSSKIGRITDANIYKWKSGYIRSSWSRGSVPSYHARGQRFEPRCQQYFKLLLDPGDFHSNPSGLLSFNKSEKVLWTIAKILLLLLLLFINKPPSLTRAPWLYPFSFSSFNQDPADPAAPPVKGKFLGSLFGENNFQDVTLFFVERNLDLWSNCDPLACSTQ